MPAGIRLRVHAEAGKDGVESMGEGQSLVAGIVVPADWDDKGVPVAVALLTPGGNDCYVEPDEKGNELLGALAKEVEVRGHVKKGAEGETVIAVRTYDLKTGEEPCIID